jgi:MFS family permease
MTDETEAGADSQARWWILALVSLLMFGNYYVYDSVAPVAALLERELGFSDTQIGSLNAIYSLPNIFLVLFGGLVVDRFGASRVALWTAMICLVGAVLTASQGSFITMVTGRFLFGVGAETMLVATTVALGIWFFRGGVAFAMALSLAVARAGSWLADLSPVWAGSLYDGGWQGPLVLAAAFAALSMLGALLYWWADKKHRPPPLPNDAPAATERVRWEDVAHFGRSFWYILALNVLFYSVIFPFRSTFAIKYFQHAQGASLEYAAVLNSYVFLAAIFATPLFGWLSDRYGHRALSMVFGSVLLPVSFLGVVMGPGGAWLTTTLLGISFSLIPAVLWPSVVKLVDTSRLGTAYGLMFMMQAAGITLANLIAGSLNDVNAAGADNPGGYAPMIVFFGGLALGAFAFAVALWRRETGPRSHGLELPGAAFPAAIRDRV